MLTAPNRVQSKPEDVFASLDDPDIEQDAMPDAAGAEPGAELANPAEPDSIYVEKAACQHWTFVHPADAQTCQPLSSFR